MSSQRERFKVLGAGIFSLILVLGVARFSYTPLLPLMQKQAGLGIAEAGWLAAINYAGYLSGALIASLIIKRFVKGEKPYTADELSDAYRIPIRITTQILYLLTELNIIIEVNYGNDDRVAYYQPAIDVNKITVSYLLTRMDEYGSENFKIDTSKLFSKEWKALLKTREDMIKANDNILLKDL